MSFETVMKYNPITAPLESAVRIYDYLTKEKGQKTALALSAAALSLFISLIFSPIILLTGINWKNDHPILTILMSLFVIGLASLILFFTPALLPLFLKAVGSLGMIPSYIASFWAMQFHFVTGVNVISNISSFTSTSWLMVKNTLMISGVLMVLPAGLTLVKNIVGPYFGLSNKPTGQPVNNDSIDEEEEKKGNNKSPSSSLSRSQSSTAVVKDELKRSAHQGQGLGLGGEKKDVKQQRSSEQPKSEQPKKVTVTAESKKEEKKHDTALPQKTEAKSNSNSIFPQANEKPKQSAARKARKKRKNRNRKR